MKTNKGSAATQDSRRNRNRDRAFMGFQTIRLYVNLRDGRLHKDFIPAEEDVIDLITDVLHYQSRRSLHDMDWERILRCAEMNYKAEVEGDDIEQAAIATEARLEDPQVKYDERFKEEE